MRRSTADTLAFPATRWLEMAHLRDNHQPAETSRIPASRWCLSLERASCGEEIGKLQVKVSVHLPVGRS